MSLDIYDFYKQLDLATLTFLETKLQPIALSHNQILFYQGDICEHILFLTKGNVRLFIQSQEGDEITLYQLNEGEQCIVNTASGLGNIEAIATAITTTDIEGYLLKIEHVKKLASISDAYQNFLFSTYTLRISSLAKLINDIKFKKLYERILDWLYLQEKAIVSITHENLANELGTTRVVVSRILKELETDGKIKLGRGTIQLLS